MNSISRLLTVNEEQFASWLQEYHSGRARSVNARQLTNWGNPRDIRFLVHNLRTAGYPICSGQEGYFYAETESEVLECLSLLNSLRKGLEAACNGLQEFYEKTYS